MRKSAHSRPTAAGAPLLRCALRQALAASPGCSNRSCWSCDSITRRSQAAGVRSRRAWRLASWQADRYVGRQADGESHHHWNLAATSTSSYTCAAWSHDRSCAIPRCCSSLKESR
jgi:hypothetical protein